jgi:hypothetical protein
VRDIVLGPGETLVGRCAVNWSHQGLSGGLRRRMRLDLVDGSVALLVINRLDRRVREIGAAVDATRRAG